LKSDPPKQRGEKSRGRTRKASGVPSKGKLAGEKKNRLLEGKCRKVLGGWSAGRKIQTAGLHGVIRMDIVPQLKTDGKKPGGGAEWGGYQ